MRNIQPFYFEKFYEILHAYVDEMYLLEKDALIVDPERGVKIGDDVLTRKQVKHIIEQRKAEGKSAKEIKEIIITSYLCSPAKIFKIQKKLNTSAAGETPHS
jgi:hypothetical protein